VRVVAERLGLGSDPTATRIVVAGTNGKGSTCAMLEAIYRAAGYRVGRYASPHLLSFTERASIDGQPAAEGDLVERFAAVERARGDTTLTYFEFSTLAVLALFANSRLDVAVLEVGLGGRLDAVNIVDADCAIVTTVDLDHTELLGPTREQIGWEKAHIFRTGKPAVCADPDPPASLLDYARNCGARLRRLGVDFAVELPAIPHGAARQWNYRSTQPRGSRPALPWPALRGAHQLYNAAGVLAAVESLAERRPVDQQAVRRGLAGVQLAARFQVVPGRPSIILDVAHNAHAARALAQALQEHGVPPVQDAGDSAATRMGRTLAVFGMLRDKDARAVVQSLEAQIDAWHLAATHGERGQDAAQLLDAAFAAEARQRCAAHANVAAALDAAVGGANADDRIVVFGSFVIVAEAMRWLERKSR
jgi:dihydrofolate synthase/folylpolyglutamate synthase